MIAGALIGSQAAAFCTLVVLPQCFGKRNENGTSRAEPRAWAAACFALTVALAAQISSGRARLASLEFRVTELGGGIALLALLVAAAAALAHQGARRYASSRPGFRAVMLAAGAVVVLAAAMSMIVSRSSETRPGQAFPWLCLLAAVLATAASLALRARVSSAGGDAWDDWDRPLSGNRARAARDDEDDWDAPVGHGAHADENGRAGQDSLATPDAPARPDSQADWQLPIWEGDKAEDAQPDAAQQSDVAPAEAARADSDPPVQKDHLVEVKLPDWDAPAGKDWDAPASNSWDAPASKDWDAPASKDSDVPAAKDSDAPASKEPEVKDEEVSDWFTPARTKTPVDRYDEDIETAASWEAPSYWFRPAVKPDDDFRDAPPLPGALPEVADEPDPLRSPD
jgi:hypothetical protein